VVRKKKSKRMTQEKKEKGRNPKGEIGGEAKRKGSITKR
jgi:hypothetical protein